MSLEYMRSKSLADSFMVDMMSSQLDLLPMTMTIVAWFKVAIALCCLPAV